MKVLAKVHDIKAFVKGVLKVTQGDGERRFMLKGFLNGQSRRVAGRLEEGSGSKAKWYWLWLSFLVVILDLFSKYLAVRFLEL